MDVTHEPVPGTRDHGEAREGVSEGGGEDLSSSEGTGMSDTRLHDRDRVGVGGGPGGDRREPTPAAWEKRFLERRTRQVSGRR